MAFLLACLSPAAVSAAVSGVDADEAKRRGTAGARRRGAARKAVRPMREAMVCAIGGVESECGVGGGWRKLAERMDACLVGDNVRFAEGSAVVRWRAKALLLMLSLLLAQYLDGHVTRQPNSGTRLARRRSENRLAVWSLVHCKGSVGPAG
jgi:hypothetical protein